MIGVAIASYGCWKSPVTTETIVQKAVSFQEVCIDGDALYWTEGRPWEKGRVVLVRREADGSLVELLPGANLRTRVHEYGGGALTVSNGILYYANDTDGQFYRWDQSSDPRVIGENKNIRYADGVSTPDKKGFVCVKEERLSDGQVVNSLIKLGTQCTCCTKPIACGHDFYSSPRFSPDGTKLAWITWDFPNMQWDGSTLWVAKVKADGTIEEPEYVAGGEEESIIDISWSPDGMLYFVSDRTGWWNLYRVNNKKQIEVVYPMEAEFGVPPWVFGRPSYAHISTAQGAAIVSAYCKKGIDSLGLIDPSQHTLTEFKLPFTAIKNVCSNGKMVYFIGGGPTVPNSIVELNPKTGEYKILKRSFELPCSEECISKPELIEYPTTDGKVGYAFYYPPKNPAYEGPKNEKPPLVVDVHGGPTAHVQTPLNLKIQYWTSRGFGVVDVNYGGSTGYGREYRNRLDGTWGIRDVEDCISAAQFLVQKDKVDAKRCVIKGGSAGGYTTLCALTFHSFFAGGTSYYGVSDLELLVSDTHKFEARYLDRLIAPYPEGKKIYEERSPLYHLEKLSRPVLLLQGRDDKIVPPNQAEVIFTALEKKKTPVAMIIFDHEGHGFRIAENIKRAFEAELYFYSKILNFQLPEAIEPVEIENLGK